MPGEPRGTVFADRETGPEGVVALEDGRELDGLMTARDRLVLAFHAEWCDRSRQAHERLVERVDRVDAPVVLVDVEENQSVAARWGITSVPTIVLLEEGQVLETFDGRVDPESVAVAFDRS